MWCSNLHIFLFCFQSYFRSINILPYKYLFRWAKLKAAVLFPYYDIQGHIFYINLPPGGSGSGCGIIFLCCTPLTFASSYSGEQNGVGWGLQQDSGVPTWGKQWFQIYCGCLYSAYLCGSGIVFCGIEIGIGCVFCLCMALSLNCLFSCRSCWYSLQLSSRSNCGYVWRGTVVSGIIQNLLQCIVMIKIQIIMFNLVNG